MAVVTRPRWTMQPDGSFVCRVGDATLEVYRPYDYIEAWYQRITTPRGLWAGNKYRRSPRGAMVRARWALRVGRVP